MARDPFEVLGVGRDATLSEVRDAYRRTAELFHPDRLQGLRESVQVEGERRLREANQAMREVQRRFGRPLRPANRMAMASASSTSAPPASAAAPSDEATESEARLYDAQLRELDADGAYVPGSKVVFGGEAAEAVLTVLRHEFRRDDGPIRMVDWGSYRIELTGDEMRTFLSRVLGPAPSGIVNTGLRAIGDRLPVAVAEPLLPSSLADAMIHFRSHTTYTLTADVY